MSPVNCLKFSFLPFKIKPLDYLTIMSQRIVPFCSPAIGMKISAETLQTIEKLLFYTWGNTGICYYFGQTRESRKV